MYPFLCVGVADDCKTRGKYTFCTARLLHYKTRGKQAEPPNSTIFCEENGIVNFLLFLNSVGIEKHYKTRMNHTFCVFADFHAFVTPAEKNCCFASLDTFTRENVCYLDCMFDKNV